MQESLREQWRLGAGPCLRRVEQKHAPPAHASVAKFAAAWRFISAASSLAAPSALALPMEKTQAGEKPFFAKSFAQVETYVAQTVLHKSGALKRKKQIRPKDIDGAKAAPKSELLGVRFRAGELSIVRLKARQAGVSTNAYIRAAAFGSEGRHPRNADLLNVLRALNLELTRQGNNLNQIAKHLNNGAASPTEAEGMLGAIARSHIQTHKKIRAALADGQEPTP